MKPHRTDGISLSFGLIFLLIVAWWAVSRAVSVHLPAAGWLVAGGLILFGVIGLLGAIRSGKRSEVAAAPVQAEAQVETPGDLPPEMHADIVRELLDNPADRVDLHPAYLKHPVTTPEAPAAPRPTSAAPASPAATGPAPQAPYVADPPTLVETEPAPQAPLQADPPTLVETEPAPQALRRETDPAEETTAEPAADEANANAEEAKAGAEEDDTKELRRRD